MNSATGTKKTVGFGKALVVFICVFVLILCGINVLGTSAHIPLVIATIVATIAGVSSGFTWDEMEKGMSETIKASAPAILIMLIIGMVVGTWMLGGIIPTMIYYGLTWLSPKIFLFAACALCVMVSTFTGSSWTTMGTVGVALVGVGTDLMSSEDRVMLTVVADTCGDHDTLGSACSCESNMIRYGFGHRYQHACRESFLARLLAHGMDKRDQVNNLNFFMYVPLDERGNLNFADGISSPGKYIELEAKMNVLVLVSNCPQLNNPCNGYDPTPVKMIVWDPEGGCR